MDVCAITLKAPLLAKKYKADDRRHVVDCQIFQQSFDHIDNSEAFKFDTVHSKNTVLFQPNFGSNMD